jgi:hypothetical protein
MVSVGGLRDGVDWRITLIIVGLASVVMGSIE